MPIIELTIFSYKDPETKKKHPTSAHFYCNPCDLNYAHINIEQVVSAAEAHALKH